MRIITKSIYLLMMSLLLPLSGCINDDSMCGDEPEEVGEAITIEFSLETRMPPVKGSRALVGPSGTPEEGSLAENYLDLNNLTFLLFDKNRTLLQILSPYVDPEENTNFTKYKVTAFLSHHYFLRATQDELTFTILVLGNYQGLSPARFGFAPGMKLEDLFDQSKVGTFAMPISNNWDNNWIPSIAATGENGQTSGYIPMSGMQTFTVATADLRASRPGNPLVLSTDENGKDINMLRALAKIEVIDNIQSAINGATGPKSSIEKVELVGYNTRGSIFPTLGQWDSTQNPYETQYVTNVSIPSDSEYRGAFPETDLTVDDSIQNVLVNFSKGSNEVGQIVFSCYLTEYSPNADLPMWVRITTHIEGDDNTEVDSPFYRLNLAPYTNGNVSGGNLPILRNNIYRYTIDGLGSDLVLTLSVEPWDGQTIVWDYSDNPAMTADGYMQWAGGTVTVANAQVLYNGSTPLIGTFAFDQPRGGSTWQATLVPANAYTPEDAFYFVDAAGNKIEDENGRSVVTGTINGQESTIRIAGPANTTSENWAARLVFTVHTFDGRTITANVLEPGVYGTTNKYFTITQNAQQ